MMVATLPTLESAVARQVGRFGKDLRVDVVGSDEGGDAISVRLELVDGTGGIIKAFDSDGDGSLDSGEAVLPLEVLMPGETKVNSFVLLPFMHVQYPHIKQVRVSLLDAVGASSTAVVALLEQQPVIGLTELCDPTFVKNRCAAGLGCKGDVPQVCSEGVAPVLKRAGYFADELGSRILLDGTDADGDVVSYTVEFLDAQNAAVMFDLDGDGRAESTSFSGDVDSNTAAGPFFVAFAPSDEFVARVAKVKVFVTDGGTRTSAPLVAVLQAAPSRNPGALCDPRGFDRCTVNNVCSPGDPTKPNHCIGVAAGRTKACASALVLAPSKGIVSVRGELSSISLWDSPEGCSSNDPKLRPEALVKLTLDAPATKVRLSTNNPYTNFDTTLYAMSSCTAMPVVAWCADDQIDNARPELAVLDLADLPAGQYFVVVDSFSSSVVGNRFQLDVTVE